ncbi:hypothetical protein, partial [Acetobacter okinawensis]|uniref:hypothetical protein n=1 Tax=Acetobacter okinawensis TaxID=1076594 RepID=UPI0039E98F75
EHSLGKGEVDSSILSSSTSNSPSTLLFSTHALAAGNMGLQATPPGVHASMRCGFCPVGPHI